MVPFLQTLEYVTTAKLGNNSTWHGTYHAFILHFQDKLCLLKSVTPQSDYLTDAVERKLIESAVWPIPDLHQVKANALTIKTTTGQAITTKVTLICYCKQL